MIGQKCKRDPRPSLNQEVSPPVGGLGRATDHYGSSYLKTGLLFTRSVTHLIKQSAKPRALSAQLVLSGTDKREDMSDGQAHLRVNLSAGSRPVPKASVCLHLSLAEPVAVPGRLPASASKLSDLQISPEVRVLSRGWVKEFCHAEV